MKSSILPLKFVLSTGMSVNALSVFSGKAVVGDYIPPPGASVVIKGGGGGVNSPLFVIYGTPIRLNQDNAIAYDDPYRPSRPDVDPFCFSAGSAQPLGGERDNINTPGRWEAGTGYKRIYFNLIDDRLAQKGAAVVVKTLYDEQ